METSVGSRHGNTAHHTHFNKWWILSAPNLGAPKLSSKKSKYPHTLQIWALCNMDFHLQKGMQVCNGLGTKYAMAKIQISLVILKYCIDLFPPHPSAWYYVSSKCFNTVAEEQASKIQTSFQTLTCWWDESWEWCHALQREWQRRWRRFLLPGHLLSLSPPRTLWEEKRNIRTTGESLHPL